MARADHHCPWTDNCVGRRNLAPFLAFLVACECGIGSYIAVALPYLSALGPGIWAGFAAAPRSPSSNARTIHALSWTSAGALRLLLRPSHSRW